jgi:xanthine dehydrogenase YagS FAD-binding subunit
LRAAHQATAGAKPLPMTGYKLDLLSGLVHDVLERLAA